MNIYYFKQAKKMCLRLCNIELMTPLKYHAVALDSTRIANSNFIEYIGDNKSLICALFIEYCGPSVHHQSHL